MKKTISINIAGFVFYIEDDGYEKLRSYLNSVQKYFATYDDSAEIISDIEGRVAERFLKKQKADNKQVIALPDVEELVLAMGSVADFEAIEETEGITDNAFPKNTTTSEKPKTPAKPLVRDNKRKLLGGVCAGIAHHFDIDPLWVRLATLVFLFGFPTLGEVFHDIDKEIDQDAFYSGSGITILLYLALWVAFPGVNTLEDNKAFKKYYRDDENKVIGGVASGVAAYFGVETGIVRLVWVFSIFFFGFGIMFYIILWIIAPPAQTLTEKMEMVGQPITLENIETNVKQALQPYENTEKTITKVLLFPFRAIASVFKAFAPVSKFIFKGIRYFVGFILTTIGGFGVIGLLVALVAALTVSNINLNEIDDLRHTPLPLIFNELSNLSYFFLFLVMAVPYAAICWLGVSLLAGENKFTSIITQSLVGAFIVGIIGCSYYGMVTIKEFAAHGQVEKTEKISINSPKLLLDITDNNNDSDFNNVNLDIEGHESNDILLTQKFHSQGRNKQLANEYANSIQYRFSVKDSTLLFDENIELPQNQRFRGQDLQMKLYIPYNKVFSMSRHFYYQWSIGWGQKYKYDVEDNEFVEEKVFKALKWVIKKDSGLVCLDRPIVEEDVDDYSNNNELTQEMNNKIRQNIYESRFQKQYSVIAFDKINIAGSFVAEIKQGPKFEITATNNDNNFDDIDVEVENKTLKIKSDEKSDNIGLKITLPRLLLVSVAGGNNLKINKFNNQPLFETNIAGSSNVWLNDLVAETLKVDVTGSSDIFINGTAKQFDATLLGNCNLKAEKLNIDQGKVSVAGASDAYLGKVKNLKSISVGMGKVHTK